MPVLSACVGAWRSMQELLLLLLGIAELNCPPLHRLLLREQVCLWGCDGVLWCGGVGYDTLCVVTGGAAKCAAAATGCFKRSPGCSRLRYNCCSPADITVVVILAVSFDHIIEPLLLSESVA